MPVSSTLNSRINSVISCYRTVLWSQQRCGLKSRFWWLALTWDWTWDMMTCMSSIWVHDEKCLPWHWYSVLSLSWPDDHIRHPSSSPRRYLLCHGPSPLRLSQQSSHHFWIWRPTRWRKEANCATHNIKFCASFEDTLGGSGCLQGHNIGLSLLLN